MLLVGLMQENAEDFKHKPNHPALAGKVKLDLSHNLLAYDSQGGLHRLAQILDQLVSLDISSSHLGKQDRQSGVVALAEGLKVRRRE